MHARTNVTKLALTEICQCPPSARIDKGEDLLADMGILPFGDRQIGDQGVKGRIDPAVVEVIPRILHLRGAFAALTDQWIKSKNRMLCLLVLSATLLEGRLCMQILGLC